MGLCSSLVLGILKGDAEIEFNQNYSIKTEEKTISLNQNLESLQLLIHVRNN